MSDDRLSTWQNGYIPPPFISEWVNDWENLEKRMTALPLMEAEIGKDKNCDQLPLRLLLAELYLYFSDHESALKLLEDAKMRMQPMEDVELNNYIKTVSNQYKEVLEHNERIFNKNKNRFTIVKYTVNEEDVGIYKAIEEMQTLLKTYETQEEENKITAFYTRYALINSTLIEDTFRVDEKVKHKLIKCGFNASLIDRFSADNALMSKDQIAQHLVDMDGALKLLIKWAKNMDMKIDEDFIKEIHYLVIKSNRFEKRKDDTGKEVIVVKAIHKWRNDSLFWRF
uniref:Uncharacterized protein n=1 Tax=Strigamia maritima TaxID=126957 RepID=T1JF37_STRMM